MGNSTPLQRVMSAIELSETDYTPVVPQMTYTNARVTRISFQDAMRDPEKMAGALVGGYRAFGYDGIYVGWESSFNLVAEAMGCTLVVPPEGGIPTVDGRVVDERSDLDKVVVADPE